MPTRGRNRLARSFGDLNVRPKLIVLHNLFFLVLTCAVYFSLIPLFEQQLADARAREAQVLTQGVTPQPAFDQAITQARWRLFLVLGAVYGLAVLLLEAAIMPLYVYGPLRKMLEADAATQAGQRPHELIPDPDIPGDEIGRIMRSRNQTVRALRRREDELGQALHRLEEQDRLVSLGLLSASVAHELNTPLAVLRGSLEKLVETTYDKLTLERLARMQRVADRLRTISESLVDFAKVRPQQVESVDPSQLVNEAWNLVAIDEKTSGIQFLNRLSRQHRVIGNPGRLVQVFVNLLRNAVNAVESPGGVIEVHADRHIRSGVNGIAISFEDNGRGITSNVLPDMFDAFVTTRLDARGTGLGLTVAEGIITQHGGTIAASNRPRGGACLEVWLPS